MRAASSKHVHRKNSFTNLSNSNFRLKIPNSLALVPHCSYIFFEQVSICWFINSVLMDTCQFPNLCQKSFFSGCSSSWLHNNLVSKKETRNKYIHQNYWLLITQSLITQIPLWSQRECFSPFTAPHTLPILAK